MTIRCAWAISTPEYIEYHDLEWGVPVRDDVALFERLSLEGFQSGLSWITVLRKRDEFRRAFENFDPQRVAAFDQSRIDSLMANAGIIRHHGKIEACINNANRLIEQWQQHGENWLTETLAAAAPTDESLTAQGFRRPALDLSDLPASTQETVTLARHLKGLGFKFLGPTTLYAALQATGFVSDHVLECHLYAQKRL